MAQTMNCPRCTATIDVSDVDPDASQGDMIEHLLIRHANYNQQTAMALLAQATITGQEARPTVKVKWVCRRCGAALSQCQTCEEPSLCGDSWCGQHIPDGES